jgi:hypothetical protein
MPTSLERARSIASEQVGQPRILSDLFGLPNSKSPAPSSEHSDDSNETLVYRRKKHASLEADFSTLKKTRSSSKSDDFATPDSPPRLTYSEATYGAKRIRSAFEAQFCGNTQALVDDFEYLLENLESKYDDLLRKAACDQLLDKIGDARRFSVFKANGFVEIALNHLITKYEGYSGLTEAIIGLLFRISELDHDASWLAEWIIDDSHRETLNIFRLALEGAGGSRCLELGRSPQVPSDRPPPSSVGATKRGS